MGTGLRWVEALDAGRLACAAGVRGAGRLVDEAFAVLEGRCIWAAGRLAGTAGREAAGLRGDAVRLAGVAGRRTGATDREPNDGTTAPRKSTASVPTPAAAAK
ncbi:hypothetical protein ARTHRO9V_210282 [Arthrobacter sp. 9V]|nr:hypothetical protein ARTHRO9V_210282 [Arthrobacter sp. 9V]